MCFSLVPRHSPSFPSLPVLKAKGSCKQREAASNGKLQATGSCKRREAGRVPGSEARCVYRCDVVVMIKTGA